MARPDTALIGGTHLILISFITNYGDLNLLRFTHLPLHEQVGLSLHLAALTALVGVDEVFSVGVIELASRLRDRARNRALADIESRMLALLRSADSSSQAPPATDSNGIQPWPRNSSGAPGKMLLMGAMCSSKCIRIDPSTQPAEHGNSNVPSD